jgi:type VI secretion system secreted protein VgrG
MPADPAETVARFTLHPGVTTDPFTLALPGLSARVRVTSATGKETMNALYRFDVGVLVEADDGFARNVMETPASLAMHFDGVPARVVHGIVSACRATGRDHAGRAIHTLRLVPRLARLKKRRTSRIFQDLTTREIVEQVLAISRVPNRWQLARDFPKRAYCVQYDETDYAFVARLCAADGIFFSFEHPLEDGAEEIVSFSDTADAYAPVDGPAELRFRAPGGGGDGGALTAAEDHVQRFDLRHAMRSKRVLLRRFDFQKPPIPHRDAAALDAAPPPEDDRAAMRVYVDRGETVYEHQQTREQALLDPIRASTALEAERADAALAEGETAGRRLLPGRRFRLSDHPLAELDGEYVVVSCEHECREPLYAGAGQPVYRNRFVAVPARVPFRTTRPPRTVRQSLETAIVVGPKEEEIHTDLLGRVKVQFHWDLQGQYDERSSAWLRVVQPWAGTGYGAQFLPRVGHEVLVGYVDGDADRPIVLGSLHNGVNLPPFTFPRDKTQSGIKTWTSPDGQGGHELLFEDRAGSELVSLRSNRTLALSGAEDSSLGAERDMRITAGRDRTDEVLGDAETRIDGDEERKTKGDRRTLVGGNDDEEVKGRREAEGTATSPCASSGGRCAWSAGGAPP